MLKGLFHAMFIVANLAKYFSQTCGVKNPKSANDCLPNSSNEYTCCMTYIGNYNQTSAEVIKNTTVCVLIPANQTFVTPYITKMDLGISGFNLNIKMDCGNYTQNNPRAFPSCGFPNPQGLGDCSIYDGLNKTCCYVGSPGGAATCLLNPGKMQTNTSVFGVQIACGSQFFSFPLVLIIALISLFL